MLQVICRIRPLTPREVRRGDSIAIARQQRGNSRNSSSSAVNANDNTICLSTRSSNSLPRSYKLDGILDCDDNQEEVFNRILPALEASLRGSTSSTVIFTIGKSNSSDDLPHQHQHQHQHQLNSNFSLFSYGQTGTGE